MTVVVDASVVVAALADSGVDGVWAEDLLSGEDLAGPCLLPAEVANILRRAELAGEISKETAALAHADLLALRLDLFPYEPFAPRIWSLRTNLTAYDAWYVALAETLPARLATLDLKLARSPGPRCRFLVPDD
ncbi:MAG: type II toxin-antitoxin system VapC family toxin [Acidobacteriota bacterium]